MFLRDSSDDLNPELLDSSICDLFKSAIVSNVNSLSSESYSDSVVSSTE